MISKNQSIVYFLAGCIPVRAVLTITPLYIDKAMLFYYGLVLAAIAISFLYLYFANERMNAFEAGGHTWWADFRLLHGLLYLCAAIYSLQGHRLAWLPLFVDTLLGLALFIYKRLL